MASSSAHSSQGLNGVDIEMGDVANETPMATPQVEEPPSQQAQATQPSPQVLAADERQSEPPQTRAPQRQDGGDTEMGHVNETSLATPPQAPEIQREGPPAPQALEIQGDRPPAPQAQATQPGSPLRTSTRENRVKLYRAALNGDWETAKGLLPDDQCREILRSPITKGSETALHVAAGARQTKFVEKLVGKMDPRDLDLPDNNGNTAFCLAAAAGSKSIVEILINKNRDLPKVRGSEGVTPLYMAAKYGQGDMARYLHPITKAILEPETEDSKKRDRQWLFFAYIDIDLFDLALTLLDEDPQLAVCQWGERGTALHMLARKPSAFASKNLGIWKTLFKPYTTSKHRRELEQTDDALELVRRLWKNVLEGCADSEALQIISQPTALLFEAAKLGNFKFLAELFHLYPDLIWEGDENKLSIFHIAVLHRHWNIFNQIHMIGSIKDIIADYEARYTKDNMLHLAAKLPCRSRLNVVLGEALQMQRELIWYQEVEKIMQPSYREKANIYGKTPRELFTEEHKDLLEKG